MAYPNALWVCGLNFGHPKISGNLDVDIAGNLVVVVGYGIPLKMLFVV